MTVVIRSGVLGVAGSMHARGGGSGEAAEARHSVWHPHRKNVERARVWEQQEGEPGVRGGGAVSDF